MALLVAFLGPPSTSAIGQDYARSGSAYAPSTAGTDYPANFDRQAYDRPAYERPARETPAYERAAHQPASHEIADYATGANSSPARMPTAHFPADQQTAEKPPVEPRPADRDPVLLSPPKSQAAMPRLSQPGEGSAGGNNGLPSMVTVGGSLSVVLGIFFIFAWALRRGAPQASTLLPGEVLEVLGRAPLGGRQQVSLVRCGKKLLLISTTPTGAETLTEITDPEEVDRLAGMCLRNNPDSATVAFRNVLQQFTGGKPESLDA